MQIVLFEDKKWSNFLPLVFTRPVGDLRIGIHKLSKKYELIFGSKVFHQTRVYLQELFPPPSPVESLHINARIIPDKEIVEAISALEKNEALISDGVLLAYRSIAATEISKEIEYTKAFLLLENITDIFSLNGPALKLDFDDIVSENNSAVLHASNIVIGDPALVYVAPTAIVLASTLNTGDGPIYIDEHAEVMEGSHIRGPFYLGEHSTLKMAGKVYGPTTIGPHCKVGGEISNCVIQGYTNKAHDGFIGNSVIGEWCNLGADTNTSNLKNNYSEVRIWSYAENEYSDTGLTFCGLIMGDHSKCGINTMFNTGTVVGICANIYGGDFPPKHIPSFSWGGADGFVEYNMAKALETIVRVMKRRNIAVTPEMINMLNEVFNISHMHRQGTTQSQ